MSMTHFRSRLLLWLSLSAAVIAFVPPLAFQPRGVKKDAIFYTLSSSTDSEYKSGIGAHDYSYLANWTTTHDTTNTTEPSSNLTDSQTTNATTNTFNDFGSNFPSTPEASNATITKDTPTASPIIDAAASTTDANKDNDSGTLPSSKSNLTTSDAVLTSSTTAPTSSKETANGATTTTTTTNSNTAAPAKKVIFTGRGLLRKVDPRQGDFYSGNLSLASEDLHWLHQDGLFWEAAKQDCKEMHPHVPVEEYVERLKTNLLDFTDSDKVHDREELSALLREVVTTRGNFCVLLGGKSVGKSLVLQNTSRYYSSDKKHLVLLVDGRDHVQSLDKGLFEGLNKVYAQFAMRPADWIRIENAVRHSTANSEAVPALLREKLQEARFDEPSIKLLEGSYKYMYSTNDTITSKADKATTFLKDFVLFCQSQNRLPCLVVDEANEVLGPGLDVTKELLTQLVAYTKQDKTMNVILTSTNYDYPYHLEQEGLNPRDLSHVVVAPELSPMAAWELLVKTEYENKVEQNSRSSLQQQPKNEVIIGMGPRLACLLLSAYGGHLLFIKQALVELARSKEAFTAKTRMPGRGLKHNIQSCLHHRGSLKVLTNMAKHGYAPIKDPKSPLVQKIQQFNIGDVVDENMAVIGVPNELMRESTYGVVPSSQSVRLVIAQVLSQQPWWKRMLFGKS